MGLIVTINISDDEEKILLNDLLDIDEWFQLAKAGKVNSCTKRLAKSRRQELVKGGASTVPASYSDLALNAISASGYKNRRGRELAQN